MQLRLTLITADPLRLGEAVHYIEHEARTLVEEELGNVGMSLKVNSVLGIAVVETFWVSGDAMRESDKNVRSTRDAAAHRANGTISVESYRVASIVKLGPWEPGNGVRVTRADADLSHADKVVAGYEDTALPWLTETEGFRGALLVAHERTGHCVSETMWTDEAALAESRSIDAAIRLDTVNATDMAVRGLEEYALVFSSARPAA
jgi:hypothetical protein